MAEPIGNELPDDESCGSCNNFKRCGSLFGCRFTSVVCDWIPSRFAKKPEAQPNLDPLAIAAAELVRCILDDTDEFDIFSNWDAIKDLTVKLKGILP